MGVTWLDVAVSLLKFEGFVKEKFSRKVIRLLTYPLVLTLSITFVMWFLVEMAVLSLKNK